MHFVSQDLKKKNVHLKGGKNVATAVFSKKHRVPTVN